MNLNEAIEQSDDQIKSWLKHYQKIINIINKWNCDYYAEFGKGYYFDEILKTFDIEGEKNEKAMD